MAALDVEGHHKTGSAELHRPANVPRSAVKMTMAEHAAMAL